MRPCSSATAAMLANPPPGLHSADLFTFTLLNGTVYRWTSYDVDLLVNGNVYSSKKPWLERSRWDVSNTMQVPTLEVFLRALNDAFAGGIDIKGQLTNGLFDGATATLDRVFFTAGTTVINDIMLVVTNQVAITTTGTGSINFATDSRLAGFNPNGNLIEVIGGGGDGAAYPGNGNGMKGGGGGQYGVISNFNPAGGTFSYQVGVHGGTVGTSAAPGTADSWFGSASATLYAQGGTTPNTTAGGGVPGGSAAAVGSSTVANGGSGGGTGVWAQGSGGGGGAGGPNGAGQAGQSTPGGTNGGNGGGGDAGQAPGAVQTATAGPSGGIEYYWGTVGGPGGGGAGGGTASGSTPYNGGNGGGYGAGGGGSNPVVGALGGQGSSGILVISWGFPYAGIRLFGGVVSNIDITGNEATINVKGKTNLLNQYAPRNLYQLGCEHAFCDAGCTLNRASYTTSYTAGTSPTTTFIPWSGTPPTNPGRYRYGTVTFTSGACSGQARTVRAADSTGLTLIHPTTGIPAAGDSFTAFEGCDKALSSGSGQDCTARSNTQNWRAFPYVPPADNAV